ncbi:heme-binding peroxidase [Cladophialophora carrionii]|uniref:Heme-binding peroxidase n=1 Tax=Cladophialophora carrionii TaxID=86049 RepID=A0A1C1C917_9EURO|nr:heme-binding peroxidase [Cladophialophora carrionii]
MTSQACQGDSAQPSLPEQLRTGTRQKHHALNTLVMANLPLCLPPHAARPLHYAKGMILYGQIYSAFEDFMAVQLACSRANQRLAWMYQSMYLPQLLRKSRLQSDIEVLKSRLGRSETEELESLAQKAEVFYQRVKSSLLRRPHVLLAYTWTMYLALFNGGRWIRSRLISAGVEFWLGEALPLSFWEFPDHVHANVEGEQLKEQFKIGFSAAASHLTDDERQDVVEETSQLFDLCSEMVGFLDRNVRTEPLQEVSAGSSPYATPLVAKRSLECIRCRQTCGERPR